MSPIGIIRENSMVDDICTSSSLVKYHPQYRLKPGVLNSFVVAKISVNLNLWYSNCFEKCQKLHFLAFCCQSGNSVLTKRLWRHQSLTSFRRLLKTGTPIFEYVRYCGFDPGKKHTQFFREMTIFDVLHQDSVLTWQYGLATTFKIRIKPRKMIQSGLELTSFCRVTLQLRTISIVAVHLCHNTQFTNKQYHFKKMA